MRQTAIVMVAAQAANPASAFSASEAESSPPPNEASITTVSEAIAMHASARVAARNASATGS